MGRVLYREYRPLSLDDVAGQEHIVTTLKNAIKNDAVAHAYLFTGTHGVGKTSVARILAHQINGLEYTGEGEHLDIIEIDAASNRRIDEIRDLRDKAHIAPTSSKFKVYIIDEVHMLTREAFNALLKTLEEPPEHVIFILATTEAHKVPHTIVSRTQRFSFKPQTIASLADRLTHIAKKEKITIDDSAIELLARHGNNSFRDAIGLLDQVRHIQPAKGDTLSSSDIAPVIGVPPTELLDDLLDSLSTHNSELLFTTTEKLRAQGIAATTVADELLRRMREKILENSNAVVYAATMKTLLEHMNTATYDVIEVAILQNIGRRAKSVQSTTDRQFTESNSVLTQQHTPPEQSPVDLEQATPDAKKPQSSPQEKPEQSKKEDKPQKTPKKVNSSDLSWQDVLSEMKGKHNTLYGILKMSQATITEKKVDLEFRFAFHEKQLMQPKNIANLKSTLKTLTGEEYTVNTSTNSDQQPAPTPVKHNTASTQNEPKPANDDLKSVSNIFSGAELLE